MKNTHAGFDLQHALHALHHYLPSQTPLKDFIHHNSLHAMQDMKFYDAIFKASSVFGYQVTLELEDYRELFRLGRIREDVLHRVIDDRKGRGHREEWLAKVLRQPYDCHNDFRIGRLRDLWKAERQADLDNGVYPLLFRILGSYLDQGIALWHFPQVDLGFLGALRALESDSYTSFFQSSRARKLFLEGRAGIPDLLGIVVGDERFYEEYLFDQQFSHHGWSGMVATIEREPHTLRYEKRISLEEMIQLELLLEIDRLDTTFGKDWAPLMRDTRLQPVDLFAPVPRTELQEVFMIWQDAFEWSYYDQVLTGMARNREAGVVAKGSPRFQAIFCIDERECSLRRYVEMVSPGAETLGCPGFFGVEFYFLPEGGKFYEKLCPAPVTPQYLIKEVDARGGRRKELLYAKRTHSVLFGFLYSILFGFWAGIQLMGKLFRPRMSPAITNAFRHMDHQSRLLIENTDPNHRENGLQVGFTLPEMADRVETLLKGIGMVDTFAPIVYLVAHGSSSANNPFYGAYDCGACSGRPGATNARVFAFMANHPEVRRILAKRGIAIPEGTQFLGAMHNTASDQMGYYDEEILSESNRRLHDINRHRFEEALDLNAKERSRRFVSIDTRADIRQVRRKIEERSVSFFEPRPELGHATNALCFVGPRELTQGLFLDRRAFMNSYDHRNDPDGRLLLGVIRPLPPVCGGINLEYYFSRVDNAKFGAGTKLPHNVMGLIGVVNSSDGDLRPGLPQQMVEVHDPVRLLIIVAHYPEVVLRTIRSQDDLYEWFANEWVHLVAVDPNDGSFHRFKDDAFHPYEPLMAEVPETDDLHRLIEEATEMETSHIRHATQENLPVHLIKR